MTTLNLRVPKEVKTKLEHVVRIMNERDRTDNTVSDYVRKIIRLHLDLIDLQRERHESISGRGK